MNINGLHEINVFELPVILPLSTGLATRDLRASADGVHIAPLNPWAHIQ
jgi:hypothetical protein